MVGAIVLSSTDAASQEPVLGSAQRVVVARARAPRSYEQFNKYTHTRTHTHTHTRKQGGGHKVLRAHVRFVQVERVCPLCRV